MGDPNSRVWRNKQDLTHPAGSIRLLQGAAWFSSMRDMREPAGASPPLYRREVCDAGAAPPGCVSLSGSVPSQGIQCQGGFVTWGQSLSKGRGKKPQRAVNFTPSPRMRSPGDVGTAAPMREAGSLTTVGVPARKEPHARLLCCGQGAGTNLPLPPSCLGAASRWSPRAFLHLPPPTQPFTPFS